MENPTKKVVNWPVAKKKKKKFWNNDHILFLGNEIPRCQKKKEDGTLITKMIETNILPEQTS